MEVNWSRTTPTTMLSFRLKIKKIYIRIYWTLFIKRCQGRNILGRSYGAKWRNKRRMVLYLCHVSLQDLAQPFVQGSKVGSLLRFVNPAVPHDSVHLQRTFRWVVHPLSITQVVKQLLCGQTRIRCASKGKNLPQQDAKRPSRNVEK